jgi:hypothetical protein
MAKHAVCVKFAQVFVQMWQGKHQIKKMAFAKLAFAQKNNFSQTRQTHAKKVQWKPFNAITVNVIIRLI